MFDKIIYIYFICENLRNLCEKKSFTLFDLNVKNQQKFAHLKKTLLLQKIFRDV